MYPVKWLVATVAAGSVLVVASVPAFGNHPPGPPERVTICHKPGTPDEQELTLPHNAAERHIAAHGDTEGPCVPPIVDAIIDADGTASPQSGDPAAREVTPGTALANFPVTNFNDSGLDMFDQDGNQAWTLGLSGDDLHAEGSAFCPTAIRDGVHQLGFDCKVLDINGDLADGDQVDCDLEVGVSFSGMPCPPPGVRYHDANGNGAWDDGEDIVLDQNNNGVFD